MKIAIRRNALFILAMMLVPFASQAATPAAVARHFTQTIVETEALLIDIPDIAEEGSVVPVAVKGWKGDAEIREITFFNIERAERPIARFSLGKGMRVEGLKTRVKLPKSTTVYAVARLANGQLVGTGKPVKVTIGGCGGGSLAPDEEERPKKD